MEPEYDTFDTLPNELIADIKSIEKSVPLVTARVDRHLADLSNSQFKERRQPKRMLRPAWAALAASILVAVIIAQFSNLNTSDPEASFADVDGSGQIDIADVLMLARSADSEQITQAEIDAFAMRIVSLSTGSDAS